MGYKLVYFNGRGRAEVCRLIFAYAGVEYEDQRLTQEQWAAHKSETPFGQLPYLEIDGTKICQSNAMARILAKRFDLYGSSDIDAGKIDMLVDCCEDVLKPIIKAMFMLKTDAEKEEAKKKYTDEEFPDFCAKFEKMLENNGGGTYFLEKFSWADIQVAATLSWPEIIGVTVNAEKYPKLAALKTAVEAEPKIAEWIAKRPKTEF